MKAGLKRTVVRVSLILACPFLVLAVLLGLDEMEMYQLRHANHAEILTACREMIAHRNLYGDDILGHKPYVGISAPIPLNVPKAIRKLNPKEIAIMEDSVSINLSPYFSRIFLLGFKTGADQYGTFRYTDCLWFWNGNINTNEMAIAYRAKP